MAAGLEDYYELAGAEEIWAAKPGEYAGSGGRDHSAAGNLRLAVCDHRARQGGFDGSTSAKLTGPIPQIAMTAGSFWPRITPS